MEVSGEVGPTEWVSVSRAAGWRPLGKWLWLAPPILFVGWAACFAIAWTLADRFSDGSSSWTLIFFGTLAVLGIPAARFYTTGFRRLLVKKLVERGAPLAIQQTWTIEPETLHVRGEVSDSRILWRGVTEIFPTRSHWLFYSGSAAYYLPRRFFAEPQAERAFIRAALGHMGEAARERSRQARIFAA